MVARKATVFTAVFEQHEASTTATVSWFDEDGSTPLDPAQTTVTKGERPAHAEPTKAPTIDTAYTFAGWIVVGSDGSVTNATADLPAVSADIAYKAAYTASVRQYAITFADWDGSVIKTSNLDYQTSAAGVEAEKAQTLSKEIEKVYMSRPPRLPRDPSRGGRRKTPQGERKPAPAKP